MDPFLSLAEMSELALMGISIAASMVADFLAICGTLPEAHRHACEAAIEASDPVGYWRKVAQ